MQHCGNRGFGVEGQAADLEQAGVGVAVEPDDRLVAGLDEILALAGTQTFLVSSSRMTGTGFLRGSGCLTRSIGERAMPSSSTISHVNCCTPLCLFNAVDAERVSIIHAWNAST
ncbi:hypothetical protein ALI22I_02585 [Saccharothrix sp. ALI-22-I]|uniref:hypothetical protein n=1 Tax=Saccharothrix sp. ALI-22-I TaxID=1933778 RepID=UPI00097C5D39|nr:hypothetical protein [Saccharothrix sp. ALI-22-I]ONI92651.1 hypothetical protein ALI22I_02585 [Saccharothrix sp. ALI-22-I]